MEIKINGVAYDSNNFDPDERKLLEEFQIVNDQIRMVKDKRMLISKTKTVLTVQLRDGCFKNQLDLFRIIKEIPMPNIKIDDRNYNTEDFDEVENSIYRDIQACVQKINDLDVELKLFEIAKVHLSTQINGFITSKDPNK